MENETNISGKFIEMEDFFQGMFSIQKKINRLIESEANWKSQFERLQRCYIEYKTIVEHVPLKISIKNEHLFYTFCNSHFLKDFNIIDDYHNKTDYDLFPEDIAKKIVAEDKRILKNCKPETTEEKCILNEKEIFLRKIKAPILNDNNQILGIIEILSEISGEKLIETFKDSLDLQKIKTDSLETSLNETRSYYNSLLEIIPIGIWIFEDDNIIFVNAKGAELLGYSKEDLLFGQCKDILAIEDNNDRLGRNFENNNTKNNEKDIVPFIHKDRGIKLISGKKLNIQYEGKSQMVIYGSDSTDQKKIEHDLKNAFKIIQSIVSSMEPSN